MKCDMYKCMKWRSGRQINQYIMAFLVNFPAILFGMIMGWVSPAMPQLQASNGLLDPPLTDSELGWIASSTFLVCFPSMLLSGPVADAVGRKIPILIAAASVAVCWLINIIYLKSELIIFARALSGIGGGICFVLCPIYTKEISDDNIRGALCSFFILSQNIGFIVMYVLGDLLSFNLVLWVSFLTPIIFFFVFLNAPESPSYLVRKGKIEEATSVLAFLRSLHETDKNIIETINQLKEDVAQENEENTGSAWKTLIADKTAVKAFIICTVLLVLQECCGYLVLLTYASEVFTKADIGSFLTANQQAIVLGVVQLVGSIIACCVVEKIGRKPLLVVMSSTTGLGMLVLGTWFYLHSIGVDAPGWVPIAAMCVSIFSCAAGFQPTPYVVLAEMFSYKLRGFVSSVAVSFTAIGDFAQTEAYEPTNELIGSHGTFWIFGIVCLMSTVVTIFFIPETKGKNLSEIYACLRGSKAEEADVNSVNQISAL